MLIPGSPCWVMDMEGFTFTSTPHATATRSTVSVTATRNAFPRSSRPQLSSARPPRSSRMRSVLARLSRATTFRTLEQESELNLCLLLSINETCLPSPHAFVKHRLIVALAVASLSHCTSTVRSNVALRFRGRSKVAGSFEPSKIKGRAIDYSRRPALIRCTRPTSQRKAALSWLAGKTRQDRRTSCTSAQGPPSWARQLQTNP